MINKKLRELRKKNNWSQTDVAQMLNIGQTTLSSYETGVSKPDNDLLVKFSNLYHVSTDELLGNEHPNIVYLSSMSKEAQNIVRIMEKLDDKNIGKLEAYALALKENQEEKK